MKTLKSVYETFMGQPVIFREGDFSPPQQAQAEKTRRVYRCCVLLTCSTVHYAG